MLHKLRVLQQSFGVSQQELMGAVARCMNNVGAVSTVQMFSDRRAALRALCRVALWRWVFWFTQDRWKGRMCALFWSTREVLLGH